MSFTWCLLIFLFTIIELKQFHFHSPSQNQIHGKNFPLEAHFVHQSKDGELAVVAVMYEEGMENKGKHQVNPILTSAKLLTL
jgi:carbonic anhydrase